MLEGANRQLSAQVADLDQELAGSQRKLQELLEELEGSRRRAEELQEGLAGALKRVTQLENDLAVAHRVRWVAAGGQGAAVGVCARVWTEEAECA